MKFHCDPMTLFAKLKRRFHYSERFSRHLDPLSRALELVWKTFRFVFGPFILLTCTISQGHSIHYAVTHVNTWEIGRSFFKIFCYIIGKRHLWCRDLYFASSHHYVIRWQMSEFHIWWFYIYINTKMLILITSSLNLRNKGEAPRLVFVNSTTSQEQAVNC